MKRRDLIFAAGISTIVIYFLGFLTGHFVQVDILAKTHLELEEMEKEFQTYKKRLENVQLQELYLITYEGKLSCKILVPMMDEIYNELTYFWLKLPPKLEVYEKYGEYGKLGSEYLELKKDYTLLTIRSWLLWRIIKERCDEDIVPALYFYSGNCEACINQSYTLDELKKENPEFATFIVDYASDEPIVRIIKKAYNITDVPSFVVGEQVYTGYHDLTQLKEILAEHI